MFSKKFFLFGILIGLVLLVSYSTSLPDEKLHIFFCDVGQGDGTYIRFPTNKDMIIDGGPNDKILGCLGRHMPFYDRTIDVVVLTHPQKDHMQGLISVLKRFTVKTVIIGVEGNDSDGYRELLSVIKEKQINAKSLFQGDRFVIGKGMVDVLWPTRAYVLSHVPTIECTTTTPGCLSVSNGNVLGATTTTDLNNFSYFMHLSYGDFDALFTGDGDMQIDPEIIKTANVPDIEVLKFPHHGSKTALSSELLDLIKPELAVISVGKNSYGHPTYEALNLLSSRGVKVERTDKHGDIEIVSDGKIWWEN